MTLAQRVRDQRYAKGWGPDELASRASISRTALYQIESGKTEQPRAATVRRIAQALDIPTEVLLGPNLGVVGVWPGVEPTAPTSGMGVTSVEPTAGNPPVRFRFNDMTRQTYRDRELERKLYELLDSPLGEGVARILEESHRMMPRGSVESGRS